MRIIVIIIIIKVIIIIIIIIIIITKVIIIIIIIIIIIMIIITTGVINFLTCTQLPSNQRGEWDLTSTCTVLPLQSTFDCLNDVTKVQM